MKPRTTPIAVLALTLSLAFSQAACQKKDSSDDAAALAKQAAAEARQAATEAAAAAKEAAAAAGERASSAAETARQAASETAGKVIATGDAVNDKVMGQPERMRPAPKNPGGQD
jgi:biotin carboxyl carrier protein